jgi:uncharacterized protein (TIGR02145 family)
MKKLLLIIATIILILNCNAQTGTLTDKDGNEYKTVKIGTQWWMAENLNFYTPTGSAYYENDSAGYAQTYGRLYTWTAGNASCPAGWHMSTHNDWKKLENYLGISPDGYDAIELPHTSHPKMGTNQGGMLKKDTSLWLAPNTGATNTTGFSALPAGVRYGNDAGSFAGKFGDLGSDAHFWAGEYSSTTGYIRVLSTNNAQIEINDFDKSGYRSVRCVEDEIPDSIKYFGQTPPGNTVKKFAHNIISRDDRMEHNITYSPDGNECYFTVLEIINSKPVFHVYYTNRVNGEWTEQQEAPFSAKQNAATSFFSKDGSRFYFCYFNSDGVDNHIWMAERAAGGWGDPQYLAIPVNSASIELNYTETIDGTIYIDSRRSGGFGDFDIWLIRPSSGEAENLGKTVNSSGSETGPCISPDGSYLIFGSDRGNFGGDHLYISFNKGNNDWTTPIDMNRSGVQININYVQQMCPSLSPDGKYLFFARHSTLTDMDIYWVSTNIIDTLKKIAMPATLVNQTIDKKVKLFPNPTNGQITLSLGKSQNHESLVVVYNLQGAQVFSKTFQNTPSATIDLTGHPTGIYMVKVIADGVSYEEKILKE